MKREFFTYFDLMRALNEGDVLNNGVSENYNKTLIDALSNLPNTELPPQWNIPDLYARIQILAQTLASDRKVIWRDARGRRRGNGAKEYARTGALQYNMPSGLFWLYYADNPQNSYQKFLSDRLNLMNRILRPTLPDLSLLPNGSWVLRVEFKLKKPYISRDDMDFYIIDNPIRKEWVFKVPYVAPSQWKGALRAAMIRELVKWWQNLSNNTPNPQEFAKRRLQLALLFGSEKGEEPNSVKGLAKYLDKVGGEEAAAIYRNLIRQLFDISPDNSIPHFVGKLYFYPTYFKRIGLEVINPHDRKTGAGKQPIYMECVPSETEGTLQVLYVPLNRTENLDEDLRAVTKGIKAMLTEYGFGAKTSSGYGIAEVENPLKNIHVLPENLKEKVIEYWNEDNHERA